MSLSARATAEEKVLAESQALASANAAFGRRQQADAAAAQAKQAAHQAEEQAAALAAAATSTMTAAERAAMAKFAAAKQLQLAEAAVFEKAALESKSAMDFHRTSTGLTMDFLSLDDTAAVADVLAQVAAGSKAAFERPTQGQHQHMEPQPHLPHQPSLRSACVPMPQGLPPPPGPPPSPGMSELPPDWHAAQGPTGTYYYNARTSETSWNRPTV